MTLTQLEYIVALDNFRHFVIAADKCSVTQPTLSMQIQKLEDELGIKIFDRSKQPVIPTEIGNLVIAQAKNILLEATKIKQIVLDQKDLVTGDLRIGIIPTIAPYLLPQLFKRMRQKFPMINLVVKEIITDEIIRELKSNKLDCGLVVTPLKEPSINEDVLFYEELFVYVSKNNSLYNKKYVLAHEIDPSQLWLLEEGHCFRSQVLNLCELQKISTSNFKYETGNIETLKRMVDNSEGITILPELAVLDFSKSKRKLVKRLKDPSPVREVSLTTHRNHIKSKLISTLKEEILSVIPKEMQELQNKKILDL